MVSPGAYYTSGSPYSPRIHPLCGLSRTPLITDLAPHLGIRPPPPLDARVRAHTLITSSPHLTTYSPPFYLNDMDSAYDHIQEESYPEDPTKQQQPSQSKDDSSAQQNTTTFNAEIQDAYKAISSSPWAARLGGFLGSVKKQVCSVYLPVGWSY